MRQAGECPDDMAAQDVAVGPKDPVRLRRHEAHRILQDGSGRHVGGWAIGEHGLSESARELGARIGIGDARGTS